MTAKMVKGIELMVQGNLSNIEIAKECGVCENTIYTWLKNEEYLKELQHQQRKAFTRLACKAQKKLVELIDSNNPSIAFAASKEVLRLSGIDAPIKIEAELDSKVIFEGESHFED